MQNKDSNVASLSRVIERPGDIIRPPDTSGPRTFCILGLGGGGTSMVAGCLRLAGIFMGERLNAANNEDQDFHDLIERPGRLDAAGAVLPDHMTEFRKLIGRRNAQHDLWGWKHPEALRVLPSLLPDLRKPHLIYIFRDIYAIAQRNHKRLSMDRMQSLRTSLHHLGAMVDALEKMEVPTLLVSYERCLRRPRGFLEQLSEFCGLGLSEKDCADMESFIRADRVSGEIGAKARERDRAARLGGHSGRGE